MSTDVSAIIEPLMKRKIFATEGEAIRELVREYTLRQISALQRKIDHFERKHGMPFEQFRQYLHERSVLLSEGNLSPKQRQALSQALMQEEDDWLDWKAAKEMLENWLGLRQEVSEFLATK